MNLCRADPLKLAGAAVNLRWFVVDISVEDRAVDELVGRNIRVRRRLLGMTQTELSRHLDMSFQQVQKYERGVNRIAVPALWRIAGALNCAVEDLFDGVPPPAMAKVTLDDQARAADGAVKALLASEGGLALSRAYMAMSAQSQRAILSAARALARPPPQQARCPRAS